MACSSSSCSAGILRIQDQRRCASITNHTASATVQSATSSLLWPPEKSNTANRRTKSRKLSRSRNIAGLKESEPDSSARVPAC